MTTPTTRKTATFIKNLDDFAGTAKLYKLSEPLEYDKPWDDDEPPAKKTLFVVSSAANVIFSGPETYIFPADEEGNIVDWGELDGSFRGGLNCDLAIENAGYAVVYPEVTK